VSAADEETVLVPTSYDLVPIGWVQSVLRVIGDTPNQREDAPHAWIRFGEQVAEGARDQRPGDKIVVLTWLHLSPRDEFIGPSCAIRPFWRQRFRHADNLGTLGDSWLRVAEVPGDHAAQPWALSRISQHAHLDSQVCKDTRRVISQPDQQSGD
jgi:hypothetical protein